jgi:hypothetical protein
MDGQKRVVRLVDCLATGKLNGAWFYQSKTALIQLVPMQFHPIAFNYINALEEDGVVFQNKGSDRTMTTRFQIDGVTGTFSYVSTTRTHKDDVGIAAAGSAVVSFQADFAILEERSQFAPGSADAIPRRLDASVLPNKPRRELGTPGGGLGIESEIVSADFHFYPHYQCPHCGVIKPLDPKGCLLKQFTRTDVLGKKIDDYLSEAGRPVYWYFKEENEPVTTAFIACSECGEELPDETRNNSFFQCLKTGVKCEDFINWLDTRDYTQYLKVAMHLSPLTRDKSGNLIATEIIQGGLDCLLTNDWQQQMLGHPSKTSTAHVSIELLRTAIASPRPTKDKTFRVCGIDAGRSQDWLTVMDFYLCEGYENLSIGEILEKSPRVIVTAGDVMREDIPSLLVEYGVQYGLIDNEPSRESSINLARNTCLELCNQVGNAQQIARQGIVKDGGIEYLCWNVRNEKFMQSVFDGFSLKANDDYPLYRLPSDWSKWLGNPSERSPLVHLSAPYRGADSKWHRGKNNIDDLYMSFLFCEVAIYLLLNHSVSNDFEVGSYTYQG